MSGLVVEKDFDSFYFTSSLKGIRTGLGLAIFLFLAFGFIVDTIFIQWMIRLAIIIPVLAIALVTTYFRFFKKHSQIVLSITYLIVSFGLIVMIYYTPKEAHRDVYSTGLTLCVFGASAIKLKTRSLLTVTPLILSFYILLLSVNHKELLIHLPLLFSASLLALLATSHTIRVMKENFAMLQALNKERSILYETKEKLEESDHLKSKLISIISHDLKGPMNNILSLLGLYNSGALSGKELETILHNIEKRVHGTKELLEDLLAWSIYKIEGKQDLARINLNDIVEECFSLLQDPAAVKNNKLINHTPSWTIISDLKLLRLIVRNMVSNAIKFTENGSIVCSAEQTTDGGIALSVSDTGIGIPEEMIERLFDWNHRFSMPGTRDEKGTGLGLLICQDFLEGIGGSIWVESEVGRGTTFHILLKIKTHSLTNAA